MSGFLVVADGAPLRPDVPSLHYRDFQAIITESGIERYQNLLHPTAPEVPFGFVYAPRLDRGSGFFVVPANVLERHDVVEWRFEVDHFRPGYWTYVQKAEPLTFRSLN